MEGGVGILRVKGVLLRVWISRGGVGWGERDLTVGTPFSCSFLLLTKNGN